VKEHKTVQLASMCLIVLAELACSMSHSATSFFGDERTRATQSTQYTRPPRIQMMFSTWFAGTSIS